VLPGPHSAFPYTPYKGSKTAFSWHRFSKLFAHSLLVTFPAYRQHATNRRGKLSSHFSRNCLLVKTWRRKVSGSLRPCRPPSPQTPHPPQTLQYGTAIELGERGAS
jgi:hypothetical protein